MGVLTKHDRAARQFSVSWLAGTASILFVSLILASGIAYAWPTTDGGSYAANPNLVIASMSMSSGPPYVTFTLLTILPSSAVSADVGPFAPGDIVGVTFQVKNIGTVPASLSSLGVTVTPSGNGFTGALGAIPSLLGPGATFTSTVTITFRAGLGNTYQGSTATIALKINGVTTTTSTCTSTVTSTRTQTSTTTTTITVMKTTTKWQGLAPMGGVLWLSTSTCTTLTITSTLTTTHTITVATTKTTTVTRTTTTTSCTWFDDCK